MKISVITPVFNSERFISRNISSVLSQNFLNFEQIIIDNISTDNTLKIARDLYSALGRTENLNIISEKDKGISEAFNKGLRYASGDIVTFLNSDDEYISENVFTEQELIFGNKYILFSYADIFFNDPVRGSIFKKQRGKNLEDGMVFYHPAMFFRKSLFEKFGSFNTAYKYAMDFELLCRFFSGEPGFLNRGYYHRRTIVKINFGGISWKNPIEGINETKTALKKYGMFNVRAKRKYLENIFKANLNLFLVKIKLGWLLRALKEIKWKTIEKLAKT